MPSSSFILLRLTADTRRWSALLTIPRGAPVQGPAARGPACCTMRGGGSSCGPGEPRPPLARPAPCAGFPAGRITAHARPRPAPPPPLWSDAAPAALTSVFEECSCKGWLGGRSACAYWRVFYGGAPCAEKGKSACVPRLRGRP